MSDYVDRQFSDYFIFGENPDGVHVDLADADRSELAAGLRREEAEALIADRDALKHALREARTVNLEILIEALPGGVRMMSATPGPDALRFDPPKRMRSLAMADEYAVDFGGPEEQRELAGRPKLWERRGDTWLGWAPGAREGAIIAALLELRRAGEPLAAGQ